MQNLDLLRFFLNLAYRLLQKALADFTDYILAEVNFDLANIIACAYCVILNVFIL